MADKIQQCKICNKPKVLDGLNICFECCNKIRTDKKVIRLTSKMDTQKIKDHIHALYVKYYGDYDETN